MHMACTNPESFLLYAMTAYSIFSFAKAGELDQCELSKDGRNMEITIITKKFDKPHVRGFSICNGTGKYLDRVINYEKPSLIPRCSTELCNAEHLPNVTKTKKFIKVNMSLTAGPLADINFNPFTVLLDVDGPGNFYNFTPLVCSTYLNHTLKVEDLTLDSGSMMTTPSPLKSTSATRKIEPPDDEEATGKAGTGHKTPMVIFIVIAVVVLIP